jgi:ABC-type polar amino acid transport system ATPase subunit
MIDEIISIIRHSRREYYNLVVITHHLYKFIGKWSDRYFFS